MLSFYTIVVIIAIIILVIALTIIGVTLTSKRNNKVFPDYQNMCPDFWTFDISGNKCTPPISGMNSPLSNKLTASTTHIGVTISEGNNKTIQSIDLSEDKWVSICDKASWAKKVGILWDGVANNNTCV